MTEDLMHVLVYADSLSWGIVPDTRLRQPFHRRWPGRLEIGLNAAGSRFRIIENCLNGRRTVFDDPYKPGRNGLDGLAAQIEMHSPLSLVVLMLGTNDFQSMHPHNAWHAVQGVAALVGAVRQAPIEPGMPVPPILIVAPPPILAPKGDIAPKFAGGDAKCSGLAMGLAGLAERMGCAFFDAAGVVSASAVDGVHLDGEDHLRLGDALVPVVRELCGRSAT